MKDRYEVTIGIPVYRSVDYIQNTMMSALNQSFLDIEFLIVDDCGKDGTMNVISHLQKSHSRGNDIRILTNETNLGVSFCRNRIIDEAQGKYLYFMDSDDTIEPDTIQLLYDAIVANRSQIAYGSYEIIDCIGVSPKEVYQKDSLILKGQDELAVYAFKNNHIFHVSVCNHLIDLEFLRLSKVRFINTSFWEDMAYTTELVMKVESAVLLSNITYHYLRRSGSLSHYQNREMLQKREVINNAQTINYLKDKCRSYVGKPYLSYLCYNLEMNSIYIVCHILKHKQRIIPEITSTDMHEILRYPVALKDIFGFSHKFLQNVIFWQISHLPSLISLSIVWLFGKYKKVI